MTDDQSKGIENVVHVTVAGLTNSGKTTIAYAIHQALKSLGINTQLDDRDFELVPDVVADLQLLRLNELVKRGTHVTVETLQVAREELYLSIAERWVKTDRLRRLVLLMETADLRAREAEHFVDAPWAYLLEEFDEPTMTELSRRLTE